jgi:hypothetical protein
VPVIDDATEDAEDIGRYGISVEAPVPTEDGESGARSLSICGPGDDAGTMTFWLDIDSFIWDFSLDRLGDIGDTVCAVVVCTVWGNSAAISRFGDFGGVCPDGGNTFDGPEKGSLGRCDSISSTTERFGGGGDSGGG